MWKMPTSDEQKEVNENEEKKEETISKTDDGLDESDNESHEEDSSPLDTETEEVSTSTLDETVQTKKESKVSAFKKKYPFIFLTIIGLIIIILCVVADQVTKQVAVHYLEYPGNSVNFIPHFIDFTLTYNTGAARGLGGENTAARIVLIVISWLVPILLIGYFIYAWVKKKPVKLGAFIICAFIVGGDIGNLIDRTFFYDRGVIDFIDITSWWPNFGIFNIADSILVCSIIALIIYIIVGMVKDTRWYRTRKARKEAQKKLNDDQDL